MGAVSNALSSIDPTTPEGLMNVATGGLYSPVSDALASADDYLRNEEGMEAAEEAARQAQSIQQQIIDLQREEMELFRPIRQSYLESSDQVRDEVLRFLDPQEQARIAQEAITGDYGRSVLGAAGEGLIAQQTALGNRLSSGIQRELLGQQGQLAQQIGQQAIGQREAQLGNALARMQAGAAGTSAPIQQAIAGQGQALTNIGSIGTQNAALQAQSGGLTPYLNLVGSVAPILGQFGGGGTV